MLGGQSQKTFISGITLPFNLLLLFDSFWSSGYEKSPQFLFENYLLSVAVPTGISVFILESIVKLKLQKAFVVAQHQKSDSFPIFPAICKRQLDILNFRRGNRAFAAARPENSGALS